ncbi:MAG: hypothetical protein Q9218_000528 [Villophora microphyllina]
MSAAHLGSWDLQGSHNASPFTCCPLCPQRPVGKYSSYNWGDFETEEDLLEDELYDCIRRDMEKDRENISNKSPNPTSAGSHSSYNWADFETGEDLVEDELYECLRQELEKEGEDVSGRSSNLTPTTPTSHWSNQAKVSNSPGSQGSVSFQDSFVAHFEARLCCLEDIIDEMVEPFRREIADIRELLNHWKVHTEQLSDLESEQEVHEEPTEADEASDDDLYDATPREATPPKSFADRYTNDWHKGGLILVENISDKAGVSDLHAVFHACGDITYLELHGPNHSSAPYIATRHAFIHFAGPQQAFNARKYYHQFAFMETSLRVFLLGTGHVRGKPGVPYTGTALEVLNFNGGQNYKADGSDPSEVMPTTTEATGKPATFSLKPKLTIKTDVPSWRSIVAPKAAPVKPKLTINTEVPKVEDAAETQVPLAPVSNLLLQARNASKRPRRVPKPKLTINTQVPRADLATGEVPPAPEPVNRIFRPVAVKAQPSKAQTTYGESDLVRFTADVASYIDAAGDAADDEMDVFQGPSKKILRAPLAIINEEPGTKKVVATLSKANGKQLDQVKLKTKTNTFWKASTFLKKAVFFWKWGR